MNGAIGGDQGSVMVGITNAIANYKQAYTALIVAKGKVEQARIEFERLREDADRCHFSLKQARSQLDQALHADIRVGPGA